MSSLIGISGKIGVGKDLMFNILNYLRQDNDWDSFSDYMSNAFFIHRKYENKKYAGKLKDIVCLLLGCTREQLEDRDFKEKELGEEWWYYEDVINGHIYNYSNMKGSSAATHKTLKLVKPTPRLILQRIGTEAGRDLIHPNLWVNALFADYKTFNEPSKYPNGGGGKAPRWIITDVRFPNEVKAIKDRGGIVIRVNRFSEEQKIASLKFRANRPNNAIELALKEEHPSETALDDYDDFDYVVENDGSIEDLVDKIRQLNIV